MHVVGHRGARNEAPENTLESFIHAFRNGCRHFELDVQMSRDKQLVVFHDTSLKRTTGRRGKVEEFHAQELAALDARQNTPGWPHRCGIPGLEELIAHLPDVEHWQFEVKPDSRFRLGLIAQKLVRVVQDHDLYSKVTLTSSNRFFLKAARRVCPSVSLGLVAEIPCWDSVGMAERLDCEYLCLNDRLATPKRVALCAEKNLKVSVWTVNQVSRMRELRELGIESVITDIPSHALKQL